MQTEDLVTRYQEELRALRTDAAAFAGRYPGLAPRLGLDPGQTADPMVERLVECMAWFAARLRLDSEARLPLAAQQVLSLIHPNLASPTPSVAIAALTPPKGYAKANPSGSLVPAGTSFHSLDDAGAPVRWRTAWPLRLNGAGAALRPVSENVLLLTIDEPGTLETLRLYPVGDPYTVYPLFDWANAHLRDVAVETRDKTFRSAPRAVFRAVGYGKKDFVFPENSSAHPAYQILREYFVCPDRFLFWEAHLGDIPPEHRGGTLSLRLSFASPPPADLFHGALRLETNAVPVVNLFERLSEPIRVDHSRHCHPVRAEGAGGETVEPHSILSVDAAGYGAEGETLRRYFSAVHPRAGETGAADSPSWYARRRPDVNGGCLTEIFFKSVRDFNAPFVASARLLCTNRDRAASLGAAAALRPDDPLDAESARLVSPPCPYRPPPMHGDEIWRLVSAMTLHKQSLTGGGGTESLRKILALFAPAGDEKARMQIRGILELSSRQSIEPLRAGAGLPFGGVARGHDFRLRLDPDAFRGASLFIFSGVIESFLGLYAGLNSFTRLSAWKDGDDAPLHVWPARAGEKRL